MLGIAAGTLRKRIAEEKQAQKDYGDNLSEAKRKGAKKTAHTLGHIKGEESEHEALLKNLWGQK